MNSDKIDQIAVALTKVQSSLQPAAKDATNPFFKSKYASLSSVWEACRLPLTENGLAVSQIMETVDGKPHLCTLLIHSSGQWLKSQMPITPVKNDPQSFGSALTYARRYGLSSIVGIVADDDDDGNQASKPAKPALAQPVTRQYRDEAAELQEEMNSRPQPKPTNGNDNGPSQAAVNLYNRAKADFDLNNAQITSLIKSGKWDKVTRQNSDDIYVFISRSQSEEIDF